MTTIEMQMNFGATFLGIHTGKPRMSILLGSSSCCCVWIFGQPVGTLGDGWAVPEAVAHQDIWTTLNLPGRRPVQRAVGVPALAGELD